jgi:hypothetical protein
MGIMPVTFQLFVLDNHHALELSISLKGFLKINAGQIVNK